MVGDAQSLDFNGTTFRPCCMEGMLYALLDSLPYLFRIMLYPTVASMQKSCATGRETSGSQRTCKFIPGLLSVLLELDMVTAYWLGLVVIHIHAGALGPLINSRYHVHCFHTIKAQINRGCAS